MHGLGKAPSRTVATLISLILVAGSGCGPTGPAAPELPRWPPTGLAPDEFFSRLEVCLREHGYAVTVDFVQYSVEFHLSDDSQVAHAREAQRECIEEVDPSFLSVPPPMSEEQLRALYPYIAARAECLADRGYPLVELPTFDAFVDLGGRFDPAGELHQMGVSLDFADVTECRQQHRPGWFAG